MDELVCESKPSQRHPNCEGRIPPEPAVSAIGGTPWRGVEHGEGIRAPSGKRPRWTLSMPGS